MLDLTKERILVTGGSGFLGQHVVRKLRERGCEVDAPTRDDFDWEESTSLAIYREPSIVIHLAAFCGGIGVNKQEPYGMVACNLKMAPTVIDITQFFSAKLIAVGSVCAYPANPPRFPFMEDDLWAGYPEPTNAPYGIAKRVLWSLMDAAHRQHGLKAAYLIPANLYGPGDNFDLSTSHVIPAMIRKFCEAKETGETPVLWGDGTPTREFLYVEDCADAILRAAETVDDPQPINVGTGVEIGIYELAYKIADLCGYQGQIAWDVSRPNGQKRRRLDVSRARDRMGWEARVGLDDGLLRTVRWFQQHAAEMVNG